MGGSNKLYITRGRNANLKEEMQNSRNVCDRWTDNRMDNAYLKYMSLPNSRIWMSIEQDQSWE